MNAAIGYAFTVLGFSAAALGALAGAYALLTDKLHILKPTRQWAWLVFLSGIGAFVTMEVALFQRDYEIAYVQQVGSSATPALFNFAALWLSLIHI